MKSAAILEAVLVTIVLTNLLLLGSSRLRTCIRMVGVQGIVAGLLPVLLPHADDAARAWSLAAGSIALKGIVFPWLLLRILRDVGVRREVEPFVGYILSLVAAVAVLIFSFWMGPTLVSPRASAASSLLAPVGMATLLVGLLVIVTRRKAVSQVLGYIVLENGTYVLGVALVGDVPALVELGVLMDAFVAVFLMGIAIHRISREFDHIDVDRLDRMKG